MKKTWPLDTAVSFDPYYGEPNRDGDQGYEILPDGKVIVRVKAPGAKEVALDQFGRMHPSPLKATACGRARWIWAGASSISF